MKHTEQQIARENVSALINGQFSFDPKKILNRTLLFDTTKIGKEIIMERIIQALSADNDKFYIEHPVGSDSFTLKREDEDEKKILQNAKNIFNNLKTNQNSVLFSEEKIDSRLLKKLKKSKYAKDSLLLNLIGLVEQKIDDEEKVPTRVDYVEKREIDRSTLYSFHGPFQLIHADMQNLEFLGKTATTPRYILLAVHLYSSKVYVYPMRSRKQIL